MNNDISSILNDDEALLEYIQNLENDVNASSDVDAKIDIILNNILNLYSNFNDRRALKASNIEAITNLLKLKSELPAKRIQTKKMILDIMTKKRELEIKAKNAETTLQVNESASELLKALFFKLDQKGIHPEVLDDDKLTADCSDIIALNTIEESNINENEIKQMNSKEIQLQLNLEGEE